MELLKEVENAVDSDHKKDGRSLGEVLQGSHNISYEAKDDTACVSLGMGANCCDQLRQTVKCRRVGRNQEDCALPK